MSSLFPIPADNSEFMFAFYRSTIVMMLAVVGSVIGSSTFWLLGAAFVAALGIPFYLYTNSLVNKAESTQND